MKKVLALVIIIFLLVLPMAFAASPLSILFFKIKSFFSQPIVKPVKADSLKITMQEKQSAKIDIPPKKEMLTFNVTDYSLYYNNLGIFHFYGIDKPRIINIISTIKPDYFVNIQSIDFTYSNKDALKTAGTYDNIFGLYTPNQIQFWIYKENDAQIRYGILHELKHHWCWENKQEIDVDFSYNWINGQPYYTHSGCFLDTPIDKEYGFIQ